MIKRAKEEWKQVAEEVGLWLALHSLVSASGFGGLRRRRAEVDLKA
jgi:hypothetical protein